MTMSGNVDDVVSASVSTTKGVASSKEKENV